MEFMIENVMARKGTVDEFGLTEKADMVEMEVGALLVGKIRNHGLRRFAKLQEKGYFEYGGSTVILLCKGIQMDKDILDHSARGIETVVRMGERIGVKA